LDLFGGIKYTVNKAMIFAPINLLEHANLLQSKSFFQFLLDSFKSSWLAVRHNAFNLLMSYSDNFVYFKDATFVNDWILRTAFDFSHDPRAMMAEAAGLLLKLVFHKCIGAVDFKSLAEKTGTEE